MLNEMTEVAQKYLGNIAEDSNLEQKVKIARDTNRYLEVYLQQSDCAKSRILTRATSGEAIGIIKSRDLVLRSGDVLETATSNLLLVKLEQEKLMFISFEEPLNDNYAMDLVRLGHILGNHHYPIKINKNKICVCPITDAEIIIKMIEELKIPGLKIDFKTNNDRPIPDPNHHH